MFSVNNINYHRSQGFKAVLLISLTIFGINFVNLNRELN